MVLYRDKANYPASALLNCQNDLCLYSFSAASTHYKLVAQNRLGVRMIVCRILANLPFSDKLHLPYPYVSRSGQQSPARYGKQATYQQYAYRVTPLRLYQSEITNP